MGIEKLRFEFWDGTDMVVSLIKDWTPEDNCKTEKSFEKSLYNHLHDNLKEIQVTKQYSKGRIRADLVVGEKVIIEIKNNLDTTSKYQRLIGQIAEYKEWDGKIIILLIGHTEKNLRKELDRYLQKEGLTDGWNGDKTIVIDK